MKVKSTRILAVCMALFMLISLVPCTALMANASAIAVQPAVLPVAVNMTGTNDATYPFTVNGNIICSTNKTHGSSSTYTYTVEHAGTFALLYKVSSEGGCDRLTISKNGIVLGQASGIQNWQTTIITVAVGDRLTVTYSKDGSVHTGDDCGWVDFSNLVNNIAISLFSTISPENGSSYVMFASGRSGDGQYYNSTSNIDETSIDNGGYDLYAQYNNAHMRNIQLGRPFTVDCNITELCELSISAFDVDESGGERDRIYLVDETAGTSKAIGLLSGMDWSWNNTTFRIDPTDLVEGHTYHFELTHEVSGWVVWVRNVSLVVNGIEDSDIESTSITASIDRYDNITVHATAKGYESKTYNVEIKATAVATEAQHGQLFSTMAVSTTERSQTYTFALESGAPRGTYRIDMYWKDPANGSVVKSATTTVSTTEFSAVAYNPNGGSNNIPLDNTAYESGDTVTVLFDYIPSRTGYTFLGWSTSSTASVPEYTQNGTKTFTIGSSDVVLYAVWDEVPVVHVHDFIVEEEPATCTQPGYRKTTCTGCEYEEIIVLNPTGHIVSAWEQVDGTYHQCHCLECSQVFSEAHIWDNGVVISNEVRFTCTVCGATKTEDIAQLVIGCGTVRVGELIVLDITVENAAALKSIMLDQFTYDRSKLELVGFEWTLADAAIADWDSDEEIATMALLQNTDVNGVVARITFRALENAEAGDVTVSCTAAANKKLNAGGEAAVHVTVVDGTVTVTTVARGDFNEDGFVDSDDAIYLLRYTLNPGRYPIHQSGDVNGDGYVDSDDAIYLLRYTLNPGRYPLA